MGDQTIGVIAPASAVKQETRRGGWFEDVRRPQAQTIRLGVYRFVQIVLVLIALFLWAKVAEGFDSEMVSGRLADLMTMGLWLMTLAIVGLVMVTATRSTEMNAAAVVLVLVAMLALWLIFNLIVTPVIVFALVMVQRDLVYVLPLAMTAAAAAFVPSLETGRYSFWRELVDQSGANSEKPILDETQIRLEEMRQEFEREKMSSREAELLAEIARLKAQLARGEARAIDPEPIIRGRKSIEECIRERRINGVLSFESVTRNGPRKLDHVLLRQFVVEAWQRNEFRRRYWLERGLKRDDWEAMMNALAWAFDEVGNPIRGVDDVIAELVRIGVLPLIHPPSSVSLSRP